MRFEKNGFGSVRLFSFGGQVVFDCFCVRALWMCWLVVIMDTVGLGSVSPSSSLIAATLIEGLCEEIDILGCGFVWLDGC